ncbi:glycosyltransferase family 4 protein [Candidatus Uhrbacteria bacterium]|nr:glycosyltransferase family 4 protein [Candidatus Uhrbacteria bacterium]MBT7716840.1 glycosyltransferase family 4 protein [Candidatus Uhrbacteria bacterium]
MHLAIDIRHLTTDQHSGIGRYTIEIIKRMAKIAPDDRFTLFASGAPETLSKLPKFSGKNITIVKHEMPNRALSAKLHFTAHTLEDFLPEKPDLWFFPNINIIKTHRPYVITMHDLSFELFPSFFRVKDRIWHKAARPRYLAEHAELVLTVSENTKQNLNALWGVGEDRMVTTPLGVDDRFKAKEQACDTNNLKQHDIEFPYILSLCTLEPRKNIETIVEAYEKWRASTLPLPKGELEGVAVPHLVIAGGRGWKNDNLHKRIKNSKYTNDIHVLGYIPEKHKPTLYRHAELFLFPSFFEGFGLPIVEAIASGTHVVTSFTGSMQEVGKEHVTYVDPFNVNDLVHAIDVGLKHEHEVGAHIPGIFSWDAAARRTLMAIKALEPSS